MRKPRSCAIPDCERAHYADWLCELHHPFLDSRGRLGERIRHWIEQAQAASSSSRKAAGPPGQPIASPPPRPARRSRKRANAPEQLEMVTSRPAPEAPVPAAAPEAPEPAKLPERVQGVAPKPIIVRKRTPAPAPVEPPPEPAPAVAPKPIIVRRRVQVEGAAGDQHTLIQLVLPRPIPPPGGEPPPLPPEGRGPGEVQAALESEPSSPHDQGNQGVSRDAEVGDTSLAGDEHPPLGQQGS